MTEEVQKENKMGYMPIPKLLFTMSMPMIISMLVQALYNVVDSAFVAQLNEDALTAVSMAFPVRESTGERGNGSGCTARTRRRKDLTADFMSICVHPSTGLGATGSGGRKYYFRRTPGGRISGQRRQTTHIPA